MVVTACDCKDEVVCDHTEVPCDTTVRLEFPRDAYEIQRILELRPRRVNRNWNFDESVKDLTAENIKHGVRI